MFQMCYDLPFSGPVLCPSEVKGDKIGLYWLNVVSSHSYIGGATAPPDSFFFGDLRD